MAFPGFGVRQLLERCQSLKTQVDDCMQNRQYVAAARVHGQIAEVGKEFLDDFPHNGRLHERIKVVNWSGVLTACAELERKDNLSVDDVLNVCDPETGEPLFYRMVLPQVPDSDGTVVMSSDMTKKAFKAKFQSVGQAKQFRDYLNTCYSGWVKMNRKYYSPYIILANVSDSGKSKLVDELPSEGVFVLGICLRDKSDTFAEPPRTPFVADCLCDETLRPHEYAHRCCALFERGLAELDRWLRTQMMGFSRVDLCRNWLQYTKSEEYTRVWQRIVNEISSSAAPPGELQPSPSVFEKSIASSWQDTLNSRLLDIRLALQNLLPSDNLGLGNVVDIVFSIDEVERLPLARFYSFRRALQAFPFSPAPLGMFCTLLGTLCPVRDLAPTRLKDMSIRDVPDIDLYPPYIFVTPLDIWWRKASELLVNSADSVEQKLQVIRESLMNNVAHSPKLADSQPVLLTHCLTLELLESFEFNCLFGKPANYPVYRASLEHNSQERAERMVIERLQKKILRVNEFPKKPENLKSLQKLSVLGTISATEINSKSDASWKLVSGHTRLLAEISTCREIFITQSAADPILAVAGCSLLTHKTVLIKDLLIALSDAISNDAVLGFRGELAVQQLAELARDKALSRLGLSSQPLAAIPAIVFLECLFENQLKEFLKGYNARIHGESVFDWFVASTELSKLVEKSGINIDEQAFLALLTEIRTLMDNLTSTGEIRKMMKSRNEQVWNNKLFDICDLWKTREAILNIQETMKGGFVRFIQFCNTYSGLNKKLLVNRFIRCAAIFDKEFQETYDLAIPVFFPTDQEYPRQCPVTEDRMSLIGIQAKRVEGSISRNTKYKWLAKIDELGLSDGLPLVGVFVNVLGSKSKIRMTVRSDTMVNAATESKEAEAEESVDENLKTKRLKPKPKRLKACCLPPASTVIGIFSDHLTPSNISPNIERGTDAAMALLLGRSKKPGNASKDQHREFFGDALY